MIKNNDEKKFAENQISKLENILLSLKKELLPEREEQFKAMAAVYTRMIREIREEIEEYTGMEILNVRRDDINIHIEGPIIGYGSAPISIVSGYLEKFKRTAQNYYMTINNMKYKRVPKSISKLTDFNLNAFQPGSINLSISVPNIQTSFLEDKGLIEALEIYFNVLKWTYYNDESYIKNIDEEMQQKLLVNTLRTLPDNQNIDRITFFGELVSKDEKIIVNHKTREKIKQKIEDIEENDKIVSVEGCIRGLDLDKLIFILRDVNEENSKDIRCKISNELVDDMKEYLDSRVLIKGVENSSGGVKVKYIEILDL